ncbi:phosphatase PAP2 family protein, partial [Sphingopyxis granuli]|uniref:phosphatase PAP2 family protein n=1 Tax=Sphingopyxis granuli TaxID=267128 RepID=UPI0009583D36
MSASLHREPESQGFDDASWLLIGLCLLFLIAFQLAAPFAFAANGFGGSAAMIGLLWTTDRFYTRYRVRPAFAALVTSVMLIILFSIVGGILSYLVAAQGGALWDARLQRWDLALGFDWLGYARWVNDHPTLATLYRWAYVSMIPQLLVMVLALTATNRLREMRIAICAAILAGLAAVLLSGLTPAVGNYIHLNLGPGDLPNLQGAMVAT